MNNIEKACLVLHTQGTKLEKIISFFVLNKNKIIKYGRHSFINGTFPLGSFANQYIGGTDAPRRIRELRQKYGLKLKNFKKKINGHMYSLYKVYKEDFEVLEKLVVERAKKYEKS